MNKAIEPVPGWETADAHDQDRQWSLAASRYEELFLDAFHEGVESPLSTALEALPNRETLTIADLGCGTGPLLPASSTSWDSAA